MLSRHKDISSPPPSGRKAQMGEDPFGVTSQLQGLSLVSWLLGAEMGGLSRFKVQVTHVGFQFLPRKNSAGYNIRVNINENRPGLIRTGA